MKKLTTWEWIFLGFVQCIAIIASTIMVFTNHDLWAWAVLITGLTFIGLFGLAKQLGLLWSAIDKDAPDEQFLVSTKERPIILTKTHAHIMDRKQFEHKLMQCDKAHPRYCANCAHKQVHEHTHECEVANCTCVVKVFM